MLALAAIAAQAQSGRAIFEKARAAEAAGDLATAESAYRALLKSEPTAAEIRANLGVILARTGRFAAAITEYERALKLNPALKPLHLNLALAYYKSDHRAPAIAHLRTYLQHDPASPQARQLLATALLESDQYEEAAALFESLPASDFAVRLGLASAYIRLGKPAKAQPLLDGLASSDSAPVQLVLGQAHLAANDFPKAERCFRRALELEPGLKGAHFYLGAAQWKQQNAEAAIAEWSTEAARDPANFDCAFALGALLVEKGNAAAAAPHLNRARAMRPDHAATLYYLARTAPASRRAEAVAMLERSVKIEPSNRAAFFLLARFYKEAGRTRDAGRALAEVQKLADAGVREDIDILENNAARR